ncbi:hypothetical protein STPH1_1579 [Streptomyces sp. OM5714]|nr:hypothetical protein STPH1_1579 [Streptomyces sp. OM5714]
MVQGRLPEQRGHAFKMAFSSTVVFEEVGQLIHLSVCGTSGLHEAARAPLRMQRAARTFDRIGELAQCLFEPVVRQKLPFAVGQVPLGCSSEERQRKADRVAESACVDRSIEECLGSRRCRGVDVDQLEGRSQVLRDHAVLSGGGGRCQPWV